MQALLRDANWRKVSDFLNQIGIDLHYKTLPADSFLPGIELGPGCLYVDADKLRYPGDILHEAGHIAVTSKAQRAQIGSTQQAVDWPPQGEELAAILWSYAAALHLGIDPAWVFHAEGYKGDAAWLLENLQDGRYIGLPYLVWLGLCDNPGDNVELSGYPAMKKWLNNN